MESSRRRDSVQAISATPFATPRYSDSVLDRDTTSCLEGHQQKCDNLNHFQEPHHHEERDLCWRTREWDMAWHPT